MKWTENEDIGDIMTTRLKVMLAQMGVKQTWLAERAGVSPTTLSMIVNGKTLPTLRTAQKIARALGTTVDALWPPENGEADEGG